MNTDIPTYGISEVAKNEPVGVAIPCDRNDPRSLGAAEIAQDLIKDGYLNQDSPLGRMVGKQMDETHPFSSMQASVNPGQVRSALDQVIKDNLGNIDIHPHHGNLPSEADYKSVMLNGLAKKSLDNLLTKQGEGTAFSSKDMPLLSEVAAFMDQNPRKFPAPDSGSWKNELREDSYLDVKETEPFRGAVDMLGSELQNRSVSMGSSKDRLQQVSHDTVSWVKDSSKEIQQEKGQKALGAVASLTAKAEFALAVKPAMDAVNKIAATVTRENPPSITDKMTGMNTSNAGQHALTLAEQLAGYKSAKVRPQTAHETASTVKDSPKPAAHEIAQEASQGIVNTASKVKFAVAVQHAADAANKIATGSTMKNPPSITDKMTGMNTSNAGQHAVTLAEQLSGSKLALAARNAAQNAASLAGELKGAQAAISMNKLNGLVGEVVKKSARSEEAGTGGPADGTNNPFSQREFQTSLAYAATSVVGALVMEATTFPKFFMTPSQMPGPPSIVTEYL
jgi:hypothetical protein